MIELWGVTAVRSGTDVYDLIDAMAYQQVDERFRWVVGMSDGEDRGLRLVQSEVLRQGRMMAAMSLYVWPSNGSPRLTVR